MKRNLVNLLFITILLLSPLLVIHNFGFIVPKSPIQYYEVENSFSSHLPKSLRKNNYQFGEERFVVSQINQSTAYTNFSLRTLKTFHRDIRGVATTKGDNNSLFYFLITERSILSINYSNYLEVGYTQSYKVFDLNNDCSEELVLLSDKGLYVLNSTCQAELFIRNSSIIADRIVINDFDNDTIKEIVAWKRLSKEFYLIDENLVKWSWKNVTFSDGQSIVVNYTLLNLFPLQNQLIFVLNYTTEDGYSSNGLANTIPGSSDTIIIQELPSKIIFSSNIIWNNSPSICVVTSNAFQYIFGLVNQAFTKLKQFVINDQGAMNLFLNHESSQVIPDLDNDSSSEILIRTSDSFGIVYSNNSYLFSTQKNASTYKILYANNVIAAIHINPRDTVAIYDVSTLDQEENITCSEPPQDIAVSDNKTFIIACKYGLLYILASDFSVKTQVILDVGFVGYERTYNALVAYTRHHVIFINSHGYVHEFFIEDAFVEKVDLSLNTISYLLSNGSLFIHDYNSSQIALLHSMEDSREVAMDQSSGEIIVAFQNSTIVKFPDETRRQLTGDVLALEVYGEKILTITRKVSNRSLVFSFLVLNKSDLSIAHNITTSLRFLDWEFLTGLHDLIIIRNNNSLDVGLVAWGKFRLYDLYKWNISVWLIKNWSTILPIFSHTLSDFYTFSLHPYNNSIILVYPVNNSFININLDNATYNEIKLGEKPRAAAPYTLFTNTTIHMFLPSQEAKIAYGGNAIRAISLLSTTRFISFFLENSSIMRLTSLSALPDTSSPVIDLRGLKYVDSLGLYVTNSSSPTLTIELRDDVCLSSCIITVDQSYPHIFSLGSSHEAIHLTIEELAAGNHVILIVANDTAGRKALLEKNLYVDLSAPMLTLNVPEITNSTLLTITANVTDDLGVELSRVYINDTLVYNGSVANISVHYDVGEDGYYIVRILSFDIAGNIAEYSQGVIIDTHPPTIQLRAPDLLNTTTLSIQANITDRIEIKHVLVYLNNTCLYNGNETNLAITINVSEGVYFLYVEAIDLAGNKAVKEKTIVIDVTPPKIVIDEPLNNSVFPPGLINVSYEVTDKNGIRGVLIYMNNTLLYSFNDTEKTFSINLTEPGTYVLRIIAIDNAGNHGENSIKIIIREEGEGSTHLPSPTQGKTPTSIVEIQYIGLLVGVVCGSSLTLLMRRRRRR
ncbi:MAG: Ig-like domain-containing protein [Candidatus Njordarchaeales archaeon]